MKVSKYEYTMQLLAAMASINIAREQKISRTKAFFRFMKSQTAAMLFDESTDMWMNGPDYIADEYRRERLAKTVGQGQKDENGFAADAAKPFVSYAIIEVGKVVKMQAKEVEKVTLLNCAKQEMGEAEKSDDNNAIFEHKPFSDRRKEYDGEIEVYEFDWGEPVGREMM